MRRESGPAPPFAKAWRSSTPTSICWATRSGAPPRWCLASSSTCCATKLGRSCLVKVYVVQAASEHGERATRTARLRAGGASARSRRSFSVGGSAPAKRRARERVGESEGRSPSEKRSKPRASMASEPRERRAPAKRRSRRARKRVRESEGRSPSEKTGSSLIDSANERQRVSLASGAGRWGPASEPVGESEGRSPSEKTGSYLIDSANERQRVSLASGA